MADCNKILEGKLVPLPACNLGSGKEGKKASALYTENGSYQLLPEKGYNISEADITVQVPQTPTQEKAVTITENGDTVISPDAGKVLSKVTVTTDVQPDTTTFGIEYDQNGMYKIKDPDGKLFTEGVITVNVPSQIDLTQIGISDNESEVYNVLLREGIEVAKLIAAKWKPKENVSNSFLRNNEIIFLPKLDLSLAKLAVDFCNSAGSLQMIDLEFPNCENLTNGFQYCYSLLSAKLVLNKAKILKNLFAFDYGLRIVELMGVENVTHFSRAFIQNLQLKIVKIVGWKQKDANISFENSLYITMESIKGIIKDAITAPENVRKLTLNSVVGKLFEQEPDFAEYQALASSKGITLEW